MWLIERCYGDYLNLWDTYGVLFKDHDGLEPDLSRIHPVFLERVM